MPRRSRLALGTLCAVLTGFQGSAEPPLPKGFVGKYVWRSGEEAFGGLSGIEVLDNGRSLVAITDKATLITGQIERDASGRVSGVLAVTLRPLVSEKSGQPLSGRQADSEGLAIDAAGRAFVSFENHPRVARLDLATGRIADMTSSPDFADLPRNGALEALAVGDGPTLYAIPEETPGQDIPVYRWEAGTWDARLHLPRDGRFVPVAAEIGPDDRLYLLERDFRGIGGFASRLRRFDLAEDALSAEATLLTTPFAAFDNLEGLSVWRDEAGQLRATMISDDNFFAFQQTQIVEFALPD